MRRDEPQFHDLHQRLGRGITLTVPNNDLADQYPELKEGSTVTLDDTTIEPYLRYRDTTKDFSNEGRIERQQTYVTAYIEKLKAQLQKDLNGTLGEDAGHE
ncbi:MAG: LCP family protein [Lachnospiraceae bacterium]